MADDPVLSPPHPALSTDRILLRPFRPSDAPAVAQSCQDADIGRFTTMPNNLSEEQAAWWIDAGLKVWPRGSARFAITLPPDDMPVGQVGLGFEFAIRRADAFYWLDDAVRGRGIAAEGLALGVRTA